MKTAGRRQEELAEAEAPDDRLLRIPTGFGKTAGIVSAWLYHRVVCQSPRWPLRLGFVKPSCLT